MWLLVWAGRDRYQIRARSHTHTRLYLRQFVTRGSFWPRWVVPGLTGASKGAARTALQRAGSVARQISPCGCTSCEDTHSGFRLWSHPPSFCTAQRCLVKAATQGPWRGVKETHLCCVLESSERARTHRGEMFCGEGGNEKERMGSRRPVSLWTLQAFQRACWWPAAFQSFKSNARHVALRHGLGRIQRAASAFVLQRLLRC